MSNVDLNKVINIEASFDINYIFSVADKYHIYPYVGEKTLTLIMNYIPYNDKNTLIEMVIHMFSLRDYTISQSISKDAFTINVTDVEILITSFHSYICDKYGSSHYKREINKFYSKNGENSLKSIIYNNENRKNSPNKRIQKFKWDILKEKCLLYQGFLDYNIIDYTELFFIATNLCRIEGGEKVFSNIAKFIDNSNWNIIINTIKEFDIKPRECSNCRYAKKCRHDENMIDTIKHEQNTIKQIEDSIYSSIQEAEASLKKEFINVIRSNDNDIHIIKAQTGIGKTNLYLNFLKSAKFPCIIVVPTNALKDEVYEKLLSLGITNIMKTPKLPIDKLSKKLGKKVERMYQVGATYKVNKYLRENLENFKINDISIINSYLDDLEEIKAFDGHLITTHKRFLMDFNLSKDRSIIVDEDILPSMFEIKTVEIKDIKKVIENHYFSGEMEVFLNNLINKFGYSKNDTPSKYEINFNDKNVFRLKSDILEVCKGIYFYNNCKKIQYIIKKDIPYKKMIIMSATAHDKLYDYALEKRNIILHECEKAKYRGKIELYTDFSYSRYCLDKNSKLIENIKRYTKNNTIITFKKFQDKFKTYYHFGNTIGVNNLTDENLTIVGIPNNHNIVYTLYGLAFTEDMNIINQNMCKQNIQFNGYEFYMNTYKNTILRDIQLWIINSNLEQAIGRARLLRNDCTVKVFARFPVEQAILK